MKTGTTDALKIIDKMIGNDIQLRELCQKAHLAAESRQTVGSTLLLP